MRRCVSVLVVVAVLSLLLGGAEGRTTEKRAEQILTRELQNRGIIKSGQFVMSDGSEEIDGEKFWIFRHAADGEYMIYTINYYYVSAEDGEIYRYDLIEDELIPIDEVE